MASFISGEELNEPARKRQKLSPITYTTNLPATEDCSLEEAILKALKMSNEDLKFQLEREAKAGILRFVTPNNFGFSGILKQRYTDFVVNEVTLDGKVVHLTDITCPRREDTRTTHDPDSASNAKTSRQPKAGFNALTGASASSPVNPLAQTSVEQNVPDENVSVNSHSTDNPALSSEDIALLDSYFGADTRQSIIKMHEKILQKLNARPTSFGSISSKPITDRQQRTKIHKDMRRIFDSRFETSSGGDGVITISASRKLQMQANRDKGSSFRDNRHGNKPKGKLGWEELGGEYLHFSLYKENRDTMEVINFISRGAKIAAKKFKFAGTKDRRAVTVQRVSVFRVHTEQLLNLNKSLQGAKLGNFKYGKHSLELGDLNGNEFLITLRDCRFHAIEKLNQRQTVALADKVIGNALKKLKEHGFINYYGLQRFGSFGVGTDEVGLKILQDDFEGAVSAILAYGEEALASALDPGFVTGDQKPLPYEDKARAHAIHIFQTTGNSQLALERMPRKFHAESNIIRHLGRQDKKRDFIGALLAINRNLRLMYLHAYQSLVWNMVASDRWARFGRNVVKGDLVLEAEKEGDGLLDEVDENGEAVFVPAEYDAAIPRDQFERARPLTAEEATSGKYTIFDIVLPTPGYDIAYPDNEIGDYYKEFMASEKGGGLDPGVMHRKYRDFSLSGSYRKLLARVGDDFSYQIKTYVNDNEQMVETDLERITNSELKAPVPDTARQATLDREKHLRDSAQPDAPGILSQPDEPDAKETFIQAAPTEGRDTEYRGTHVSSEMATTTAVATSTPASTTSKLYHFSPINTEALASDSSSRLWKRPEAPIPQIENKLADISPPRLWKPKTMASPVTSSPVIDSPMPSALTPETTGSSIETKLTPDVSKPGHLQVETTPTQHAAIDCGSQSPLGSDGETIIFKARDPTYLRSLKRQTQEDEARKQKELDDSERYNSKKIAVVVKFQLSSSQYATMALRELMSGGVQTYQADFNRSKHLKRPVV